MPTWFPRLVAWLANQIDTLAEANFWSAFLLFCVDFWFLVSPERAGHTLQYLVWSGTCGVIPFGIWIFVRHGSPLRGWLDGTMQTDSSHSGSPTGIRRNKDEPVIPLVSLTFTFILLTSILLTWQVLLARAENVGVSPLSTVAV